MFEKIEESCEMILNNLKNPEQEVGIWFFSNEEKNDQNLSQLFNDPKVTLTSCDF